MDPQGVIDQAMENSNACCGGAAAAAMAAAKRLGAEKSQILAYSTSYDVVPNESFVGYVGAFFKDSFDDREKMTSFPPVRKKRAGFFLFPCNSYKRIAVY